MGTRAYRTGQEVVSTAAVATPLFDGVFLGGFECSEHRTPEGRRLDMLASTRHDELAQDDYARLRALGITASREGVGWVRSEPRAAYYDFSRAGRLLRAAEHHDAQVIWDLMHFGWPDDVDVFSATFPLRFGRYAKAFARWLAGESGATALITPINEMSYLAWAGGDVRCMNPFAVARGVELKAQLVRATIEAIEGIRDVLPNARFLQPEPLIAIVAASEHPKTWRRVDCDNALQFQAWDMLAGRVWPALGGHERYLDVIGVNFYPDNQFMLDGTTIARGHPRYRALSDLLLEVGKRYGRPLVIAETGSEGDERADWLRYVADECVRALRHDCELHAIALYPIVNHPGWADERHCLNGVWDYADAAGDRAAHLPLADEIRAQTPPLIGERQAMLQRRAQAASATGGQR